jgi:hypothetical protein
VTLSSIDEIRILLKYLGTPYDELLDNFRPSYQPPNPCDPPNDELKAISTTIIDHAVNSEYLGFIMDEYKIICKEAFWPKRYFEITKGHNFTDVEYQADIGIQPAYKYWGYDSLNDMRGTNESTKLGLTFVKSQFLPRSGIQYIDLVNLLKTQYVNPYLPKG